MIQLDTIYNEDCLEGMKRIPDGSVDAVICDLPYGVLNAGSEGGSWDMVIPFEPLWEQYKRVTKPNAAIVLFAQGMFTAKLMMSQPKMWRYNLVWNKTRTVGFLNAHKMPLRSHEDVCVFYDNPPTYNPQFTKGTPNHSRGRLEGKQTNRCYGKANKPIDVFTSDKFPKSIIDIPNNINGNFHPTQKPIDLLRYLVLSYTNPRMVILDNCIGSGTTAIACLKERRHFIGFELNKEYYDKACKRIREEQRQLKFEFEE
jgi:site-specific DNA-methyltransferase (adenine-specific)/modification methylase